MARATLTRDSIIDACLVLVEVEGEDRLTLRRLGEALGTDPTAIYRHFRDKDDLMRAIADRIHGDVLVDLPDAPWNEVVREVCIRLRRAHLDRPALAAHVRTGPPLHHNEFALTEVVLGQLLRGGLSNRNAALAYHALIELTVGSASLDAPLAALDLDERVARYGAWRRTYAALDDALYPTSVALAPHLYDGSADARFAFALDTMLTGLTTLTPHTGTRR
jgi:TetR/AcrR family tetracycline transcriptional repressor